MIMMGWPDGSTAWAAAASSMAVEFEVTDYSTTGTDRLSSDDPIPIGTLCGDGVLSRDALFESDRHVTPHLDGQNDRGGQQQGAHGDVNDGRDYHGQFGLDGVSSPHDAGDEG